MRLTTVKLDPTRILYTIPISKILTEEDLHVANSTSCTRRKLFNIIVAFVDYQYIFSMTPDPEMTLTRLETRAGPKANVRLYNVVTAATARLTRLMPANVIELTVVSYSRHSLHVLATIA